MKKGPNVKKMTKFHTSMFFLVQFIVLSFSFFGFVQHEKPPTYEELEHDTIVIEDKNYNYMAEGHAKVTVTSNNKTYEVCVFGDNYSSMEKTYEAIQIGDVYEIAYYDHYVAGSVIYGMENNDIVISYAEKTIDESKGRFKFNWWFLVIGELHAFAIIIVPKVLEVRALRKIETNQERKKEKRRKQLEQRNANIKKE